MTQTFGASGPLEWVSVDERLERARERLVEVQADCPEFDAAGAEKLLQQLELTAEGRRDRLSTRLMEAFRLSRSRTAFGLLYELNASHLYQQVAARLRRYRCRADALDVLQEVFFNIYRYPHRFNDERPDAFRVWTATIVRNTVLKHLRSLSRSGRSEVALDDVSEPRGPQQAEPLRGVIEGESQVQCTRVYLNYLYLYLRFYRMLSDREQRAIHLVEVAGASYRDAAGVLGIKLENLKMVIFRARRKIHRSMRRVFEGLPPDLRPARGPASARRSGTESERDYSADGAQEPKEQVR